MPVRASPYAHQQSAYEFCYRLFTEDASVTVMCIYLTLRAA